MRQLIILLSAIMLFGTGARANETREAMEQTQKALANTSDPQEIEAIKAKCMAAFVRDGSVLVANYEARAIKALEENKTEEASRLERLIKIQPEFSALMGRIGCRPKKAS